MIFLNYDINGNDANRNGVSNIVAPPNLPIKDSVNESKYIVVPTRPIPAAAHRNYLKFDRVKDAEKSTKRGKQAPVYRHLLAFILKNFGILTLTIIYVIVGAILFQTIEQPNEIAQCQLGEGASKRMIYNIRVELVNYIYYNTSSDPYASQNDPYQMPSLTSVAKDGPSVYQPKLTQMLQDFRDQILQINADYKYYGQDCVNDSQWNLLSAILFTMSIVSTLGIFISDQELSLD